MIHSLKYMTVRVASTVLVTQAIKEIILESTDGRPLPSFTAGAHIKVVLGNGNINSYSLMPSCMQTPSPQQYRLGILREENSKGGSRFMHTLSVGDEIEITAPINDFPLVEQAPYSLLFAGGIGVTPILAMAVDLHNKGARFAMHYAGRTQASMGFIEPLTDFLGDTLHLHFDDKDNALNLLDTLNGAPSNAHIYVCGPKGLIQAVQKQAEICGYPSAQIHFELFSSSAQQDGDVPFEIELADTGDIYTIPVGKTIVEVLEDTGHDPIYDCARGDCGVCKTKVISGNIDHRDVVLSSTEKAAGNVMQICVSRAKGGRLVLDLQNQVQEQTEPTPALQTQIKSQIKSQAKPQAKQKNIHERKKVEGLDLDFLIRPGASEIHRDVFTDQTVFEQEMRTVFRHTWVYVGHDSQVPNKGDFTTTTIGNQPVIMVRHQDGEVQVLYNRCPHKGVQLVNEPNGHTGKFFRCPYHAWTFKTNGSPLAIPFEQGYENTGFEKSCAKKGMCGVKNVKNYRGFIFARLSDEGESFDTFFTNSLSSIDNMIDRSPEGKLEIVGAPLRYLHHCNWKMLVDNQTDTCHPMIAHESSAGTVKDIWERIGGDSDKPMVVELVLPFMSSYEMFETMGIRTWDNGHGHTGVSSSIHSDYTDIEGYFAQMSKAYGKERAQEIISEARHNTCYFPNMMVKGAIQTLRLFKPIAADKTIVESWIFKLVGAPDTFLKRTAMYNRIINAPTSIVGHDDLEMYERAQEGLKVDANPWVNIQRHYREDELGEERGEEIVHAGTSEVQMRNHYVNWKKYMALGANDEGSS